MRTGQMGWWSIAVAVEVTLATDFGASNAPDALGSDGCGGRRASLGRAFRLPKGALCQPQSA